MDVKEEGAMISATTDEKVIARKIFQVVSTMMRKINDDTMKSALNWKVLFSHPIKGFVGQEEAEKLKLTPWFDEPFGPLTETNNVDLNKFLDNL